MIACQPTRGLDVAAAEYIRRTLVVKRNEGLTILLISEDWNEILELSDRIAVIFEGEIVGTLLAAEANIEKLGYMMLGGIKKREK